jgi:hypothetical protein
MVVYSQKTTQRYNSEDHHPDSHFRENVKPCKKIPVSMKPKAVYGDRKMDPIPGLQVMEWGTCKEFIKKITEQIIDLK